MRGWHLQHCLKGAYVGGESRLVPHGGWVVACAFRHVRVGGHQLASMSTDQHAPQLAHQQRFACSDARLFSTLAAMFLRNARTPARTLRAPRSPAQPLALRVARDTSRLDDQSFTHRWLLRGTGRLRHDLPGCGAGRIDPLVPTQAVVLARDGWT